MTQVSGLENQGPVFEIVSARIYDEGDDRKHVIYTLQVRHISGTDDLSPSVIERRYTHFLELYNGLKKDFPNQMNDVVFPRKVILGNFDNDLISTRSSGFEQLLKHISTDGKLRTSKPLIDFMQNVELAKAKLLLDKKEFSFALPILENSFRLLNKVFTDRNPAVLLALCRLLGSCLCIPGFPNAQKWADLALHRYEGVSDSDLLQLYVPLLQVCIKLWQHTGRNSGFLERRLSDLKRQGVQMNEKCSLLEEVNTVEAKIFQ